MRKLRNEELNRLSSEAYTTENKNKIVIILDNVRSANNVGSVFRTSDAFLIEKIILCGITATPPNKEIHKTALGSENTVEWTYSESTIKVVESLKIEGYKIYAIEQVENSILLQDFEISSDDKIAIIFGNEVKGVEQDVINISDNSIEIPQFGTKHSLNISVTCGIVIWDIFKKIRF
jgi:23S rRNA (guanosine2251-2'-O)-methyltransferase